MMRALEKGALVKHVRHKWRKALFLYSEVSDVKKVGVQLKIYKQPNLLMSQGNGLRFSFGLASQYKFGDTVKQFDKPVGGEDCHILSEFFILHRTEK